MEHNHNPVKEVFILLGSNRGKREDHIFKALELIRIQAGEVIHKSALYESPPWGFEDPTPFLNLVVEIETTRDPQDLLDQLLNIEIKLGRIRLVDGKPPTYSGRTIDIDILFYGQHLIFTDSLMIPHPRIHERRFALVPLNDIAPEFVHPLLKKTISVLLLDCRDLAKVKEVTDFRF